MERYAARLVVAALLTEPGRDVGLTPKDVDRQIECGIEHARRQHAGRKDETVGLITDLEPGQLPPAEWLKANRMAWGIENGTHQRLDVSLNEDRCRVRNTNGLWIMGMLRRLIISLFMHWRNSQTRPQHKSLTDFQAAMGEDNLAKAFAFVTHRHPKLT